MAEKVACHKCCKFAVALYPDSVYSSKTASAIHSLNMRQITRFLCEKHEVALLDSDSSLLMADGQQPNGY
jgi:hypothetical protein